MQVKEKTKFEIDEDFLDKIHQLRKLRTLDIEPSRFWNTYLKELAELLVAKKAALAVQKPASEGEYSILSIYPEIKTLDKNQEDGLVPFSELENIGGKHGLGLINGFSGPVLGMKVYLEDNQPSIYALFLMPVLNLELFSELEKYLYFVVDIPSSYNKNRIAVDASRKSELLASTLDFMVLIDEEDKFLSAAMVMCNELAARLHCDCVSLGWLERGYVRVKAISHRDNFDKKMEATQLLESLMEESLDQNAEIVWPADQNGDLVTKIHENYSKNLDVKYIVSLPLRLKDDPFAVVTCERQLSAFSPEETSTLRLTCDQASRRLYDLKSWDRWIGGLLLDRVTEKASSLLGPKHTWVKLTGISVALLMLILCFVKITYRVEASGILRSEDVRYITAPFDGHIERVDVRLGDSVSKDASILEMDTNDLRIEEAGLIAEQTRYQRELEKARAANALADMRIAEARQAQVAAQIDLVRYQLNKATIKAPFEGIVVEGDLKEKIGSPLRQGEILFKVAQLDNLYVELEVKEEDIHYAKDSVVGELSLASRPQETFDIEVIGVEPVAMTREGKNIFLLRGRINESAEWFRPGMTGIVKLNSERKTLLWILTHRTTEFLRMYLWW